MTFLTRDAAVCVGQGNLEQQAALRDGLNPTPFKFIEKDLHEERKQQRNHSRQFIIKKPQNESKRKVKINESKPTAAGT